MNTFYLSANATLRFARKAAITVLICQLAASSVAPTVVPPSPLQDAIVKAIVESLG